MHKIWKIVFYPTSRGSEPVQDFIQKQDASAVAKIFRTIDLLQEHGPLLGMPYTKYLGDHLSELRIRGKNEVRIFYFYHKEDTIMLLHAFNKKTQKTPTKELEIAKKRKRELTQL